MASWLDKLKEKLVVSYDSHQEASVFYHWCAGLLGAYALERKIVLLTGHIKGSLLEDNYAAFLEKLKQYGDVVFRNVGGKNDNSVLLVSESTVALMTCNSG